MKSSRTSLGRVAICVVDRDILRGIAALRAVCEASAVDAALQRPGQWLVGAHSRCFAVVLTVAREAQLFAAHRGLLHLPLPPGMQIELCLYLDPDLRQRVIEDAQLHALRVVPAGGCA